MCPFYWISKTETGLHRNPEKMKSQFPLARESNNLGHSYRNFGLGAATAEHLGTHLKCCFWASPHQTHWIRIGTLTRPQGFTCTVKLKRQTKHCWLWLFPWLVSITLNVGQQKLKSRTNEICMGTWVRVCKKVQERINARSQYKVHFLKGVCTFKQLFPSEL